MTRSARILVPALVGVTAVVAGCGGSSGGGDVAQGAAKETAAKATSAAPAARRAWTVAIKGFEYRPARLVVKRGARVTWIDKDAANHTVTFKRGPRDLGNVDEGKRLSTRFTKRGTFAYVCQYHPNMHGTVVVK